MRDFLSEEKGLCAEVESLCMTDPDSAHALIDSVISDCGEVKSDRAQSASVSRVCCRFLMHRKMKSRLVDTLKTDDGLRKAIFGELNTYKYSLVFLFRRLIRLNETELTQELLTLLENRGNTVPRERLLETVWPDGTEYVEENALSVAVSRLRAKLEDTPSSPVHILNVYGIGYVWK